MKHYVAYHNTEKMRGTLHEYGALRLLTNKSKDQFLNNAVWFVIGEGTPRKYLLASVFVVSEVGETGDSSLRYFASGPGYVFTPPISLKEKDWFPDLFDAVGKFAFSPQNVRDGKVIAELIELAAQAGYKVS